ncbi:dihydrolipoamide acetyltransferase family protein [Brevibacillus panacihumi]|uniref:dihydrolipoamide acetyltransferase family protein n=1 Tax=Brevibacillus panacihumi TaxID=497735 RepID=UPI003D1F3B36
MAHVITMPKFGLTMTEGTVTNWFKSVGDWVEQGEVLFEVQTDKITNEVQAAQSGVLRHIFVAADETAQVGGSLAILADLQEDISSFLEGEEASPQDVQPPSGFIRATPLARKLAREQGLDLADLTPSEEHGILLARDLSSAAIQKPKISPLAKKYAEENGIGWETIETQERILLPDVIAEQLRASGDRGSSGQDNGGVDERVTKPLTATRKVIAERMTQSWRDIPQVTLTREVDVTQLRKAFEVLAADAAEQGIRVSMTHFLILLVAQALKRHPVVNAWYQNQELTYHSHVHMGVAAAVPHGLLVPVIRQACRLSLVEIASALQELTAKAKEQRLDATEMQGGTFTISNLGMMQVDGFTPILNSPQTGILGIGRVTDKPVFIGDDLVNRSMITFSLTFDHRAMDGVDAAQFLQTLASFCEEPLRLLAGGRAR